MFIGMSFGKAHVPWWATWILFIYILFHIIVEITLEIHQCCTHKKNKGTLLADRNECFKRRITLIYRNLQNVRRHQHFSCYIFSCKIFFPYLERRKKYEFQKRENPKANIPEPEPAVSNSIWMLMCGFYTLMNAICKEIMLQYLCFRVVFSRGICL